MIKTAHRESLWASDCTALKWLTALVLTALCAGCGSPFLPLSRLIYPIVVCPDGSRGQDGIPCGDRHVPFTPCWSPRVGAYPRGVPAIAYPTTARATQLGLGFRYACALDDGAAQCWGVNELGQTDGDRVAANCDPHRVRVPPLQSLSVGETTACGLADGEIWCWGSNERGIRARSEVTEFLPTRIDTPLHPTAVAVGSAAACVLADRTMWCWGALRQQWIRRGVVGERTAQLLRGPTCPEHYECSWVAVGLHEACIGGSNVAVCASFAGPDAAAGGWAADGAFREGEETRFNPGGSMVNPCFMGDQLCYIAPDYHAVYCGGGGFDWHVDATALACSRDVLCVLQENRALCRRYAASGMVVSEFEVAGSFTDLAVSEGGACGVLADGSVQCGGWATSADTPMQSYQ